MATRPRHNSMDFYPRSPCGERPVYTSLSGGRNTFLSTLSLRRATMVSLLICNANFDFYPRSPCGERHGDGQDHRSHLRFLSTLSLRRATWQRGSRITYVEFLSTLSLRRATEPRAGRCRGYGISIHALLAESDSATTSAKTPQSDFYPRSPCGERL